MSNTSQIVCPTPYIHIEIAIYMLRYKFGSVYLLRKVFNVKNNVDFNAKVGVK